MRSAGLLNTQGGSLYDSREKLQGPLLGTIRSRLIMLPQQVTTYLDSLPHTFRRFTQDLLPCFAHKLAGDLALEVQSSQDCIRELGWQLKKRILPCTTVRCHCYAVFGMVVGLRL